MIPEKITPRFLEHQIEDSEFQFDESGDDKWSICILTIANGFKVIGTSHRQFAVEHNRDLAKSSAYQAAFDKLWAYYTFLAHYKYQVVDKEEKERKEKIPSFVNVGSKFYISLNKDTLKNPSNIFILALVDGSSLAFINVHDGIRWRDPVRLKESQMKENVNYNDIWTELIGNTTYWKEA